MDKPRSLQKLDSVVLLERLESAASSHVYVRQETSTSADGGTVSASLPTSPVAILLSIRHGRLAAIAVVVVIVLVTLTLVFHHGVELTHFVGSSKTPLQQTRLLNDYNSYTGSIASLLSKPVELFVTLAVDIVVLRFLTAKMLQPLISWKMDALALILSASVGYLISNGFAALNVQLRPLELEPRISAGDLTYVADNSLSDAAARSSNVTRTVSERSSRNPITNTVLRNLVLPRVPPALPRCDWRTSQETGFGDVPDLVVEYGFAQRDWQSRLLQEAVDPTQLRVVVNATKPVPVDAKALPMNASVAADLFVYSMLVAPSLFPWSTYTDFVNDPDIKRRYPTDTMINDATARVMGLLPPAVPARDENAQREWFVHESATALARKIAAATNTSRTDVVLEFSHVEISPTITFDAVTIEFEVDPRVIAGPFTRDNWFRRGNATWFNELVLSAACAPWPATCMMAKAPYPEDDTTYDPPAQVQVFGACVNANGSEVLHSVYKQPADGEFYSDRGIECDHRSNTSFMVVSIGKRMVADALTQNRSANESGVFDNPRTAVTTNLRKIYTYTMARLSWVPLNLSDEFHAVCETVECNGLRFPLRKTAANPSAQELVVGVDALPVTLLTPPLLFMKPRFLPLVRLREPSRWIHGWNRLWDACVGDPLLLHNVGNVTWDWHQPLLDPQSCSSFLEDHVQVALNNHWYIEHGLQTAYTAATFFLLQHSVVQDVAPLSGDRQSLHFQHNVQRIAVLASIPRQNAWLTLSGCVLVIVGLGAIIGTATIKRDANKLGHIMTPHVVARVMLDAVHFPPLLLDRAVATATHDGLINSEEAGTADEFVIDALSLSRNHMTPGTR